MSTSGATGRHLATGSEWPPVRLLLAALLVLAVGCSRAPGKGWSPEEGQGTLSLHGTYWVSVLYHGTSVVAGEVPLNEEFDVEVRLFDGATREPIVEGVELRVDARMPVHGHGMKQDARAEQQTDGSWLARPVLLHMTGPWELHVDVTRGAVTERAQYAIVLE